MTSVPQDTRVIGSLRRMQDGKGAVRMEDVYDTDIKDLWSAVTDPRRLARWIAVVDGDLQLGGSFQATFTSSWAGPGRVEVCREPHQLSVVMSPGQPDETVIEATLAAEGGRTRLVVEERGLPVDQLAVHGAGWQTHMEDLASHLGGRDACDWATRWTELAPTYREIAAGMS